MKKRKEKTAREGKLSSKMQLIVISSALVAIIVLAYLVSSFLLKTQEAEFSLKAAIVDQLGKEFQSSDFNETGVVADILESAGFSVSYHRSETVDVGFYKGLTEYDYGIVIFRSHSATREGETIVDFFTSEEFSEHKYVSEQDDGLLTKGYYSLNPEKFYFAITPKFIENLEGCFPKSIVIAMGCNSLNKTCTEMAEAFTNKGATAYIGWTGLVEPSHTDNETVELLRTFLVGNKTLDDAVSVLMPDPLYGGRIDYYPPKAGDLTMSSLIRESKESPTKSAMALLESILAVCVHRVASRFKDEF